MRTAVQDYRLHQPTEEFQEPVNPAREWAETRWEKHREAWGGRDAGHDHRLLLEAMADAVFNDRDKANLDRLIFRGRESPLNENGRKLTGDKLSDFVIEMQNAAEDTRQRIDAGRWGLGRGVESNESVKRLENWVNHRCLEHIVERTPGFPLEKLGHVDQRVEESWRNLCLHRMANHGANTDTWGKVAEVIEEADAAIQQYRAGHGLPTWFRSELFTTENITVAKDQYQMGWNEIHNQPLHFVPDPLESRDERDFLKAETLMGRDSAEAYLRDRLDTWLHFPGKTNLERTAHEVAEKVTSPYVDEQALGSTAETWANAWQSQTVGAVAHATAPTQRFIDGDTAKASAHAAMTGRRLLADLRLNGGIAEAVARDDEEALLDALGRTAVALDRMASHVRSEMAEHATSGYREEIKNEREYPSPIRWEEGAGANWKALIHLTEKLQDPRPIADAASQMMRYASEMLPQWDTGGDAGDPTRFVMKEILSDLHETTETVAELMAVKDRMVAERVDYELRTAAAVVNAATSGASEDELEKLRMALTDGFNMAVWNNPEHIGYNAVRHQATLDIEKDDLKEVSGLKSPKRIAGTEFISPKEIALYDRAARLLAHADYNMQSLQRHTGAATQALTI